MPAVAKDLTYKIGEKTYEGFVISKGKKSPTVFIVHDWDGLTDYEKKRAQMVAAMGFSVFAVDLFGKGVRPSEEKDKKQKTGELYKNRKKMRELLQGAVAAAEKHGLNVAKSVAVGYCFGGAAVLELARSGAKMQAFVSFHGGLETPEDQSYKSTQGSVWVFHGTADTAVSMEDFANLAKELETANVTHEMITYSGAPHAFTVFGTDRYQKVADNKSWSRFQELLRELKSKN